MESGNFTLAGAAKTAGVDRSTVDKWADADEAFAQKKRDAEVARARRRLENLGDALYHDALEGRTTGNERIYLLRVYAASVRRRGEEPALDWDRPDKLELSGTVETEHARETLERKLLQVRDRLAFRDGDEDAPQAQTNGAG